MSEIVEWQPGVFFTSATFMPGENWQVNNAVLIGSEGTLVWDTFASAADIRRQAHCYRQPPVTAVYSHADWDHCWGTQGYPFDQVIAHQAAPDRFVSEMTQMLANLRKSHRGFAKALVPVPPTMVFSEALTLDFGTFQLELSFFGGHTKDSIVGFIPKYGLLLAGDVAEKIPVINQAEDVDQWITSLAFWASRADVRHVLPGHGKLADRTLLDNNYIYLTELISGTAPEISTESDFYLKAHRNNCRIMGTGND